VVLLEVESVLFGNSVVFRLFDKQPELLGELQIS
jgi:hypothetical protein